MPAQHTSITKGLIPLYYLQYVMHTTGEHYNVCKLTGFILVDIGEVGRHSDGGGVGYFPTHVLGKHLNHKHCLSQKHVHLQVYVI